MATKVRVVIPAAQHSVVERPGSTRADRACCVFAVCLLAALLQTASVQGQEARDLSLDAGLPDPRAGFAQFSARRHDDTDDAGLGDAGAPMSNAPAIDRRHLVVSGGVSLGSYIGGYTYYLTLARQQQSAVSPGTWALTAGASAGAINAVIAGIAGCSAPQPDPVESLFYKVWIPVGLTGQEESPKHPGAPTEDVPGLANKDDVTSRSLLSRRPLEQAADTLEHAFRTQDDSAERKSCDTAMAIVATRVQPRDYVLQDPRSGGTPPKVPRQTEKFVLRLQGVGGQLKLTSVVPEAEQQGYPSLGPEALAPSTIDNILSAPVRFEHLRSLLFASAAVPVAFAPQPLVFRFGTANPERDDFVDGGVFENVPLGLALRVAENEDRLLPPFTVIDPDVRNWFNEASRGGRCRSDPPDLIPWTTEFIGGAVGAFRGTELSAAFDYRLRAQPGVTLYGPRGSVTAGEQLSYFGAFMERDFRIFDFYMGMLDGLRFTGVDLSPAKPGPSWDYFTCAKEWDSASERFTRWPDGTASLSTCKKLAGADWLHDKHKWSQKADGSTSQNFPRFLATSLFMKLQEISPPPLEKKKEAKTWFEAVREQGVKTTSEVESKVPEIALRKLVEPLVARMARRQSNLAAALPFRVAARVLLDSLYYRNPPLYYGIGLASVRGGETYLGGYLWQNVALESAVEFTDLTLFGRGSRVMRFDHTTRLVYSAVRTATFQLEPLLGLGINVVKNTDNHDKHLGPQGHIGIRGLLFHRVAGTVTCEYAPRDLQYQWGEGSPTKQWRIYGSIGFRFPKFAR